MGTVLGATDHVVPSHVSPSLIFDFDYFLEDERLQEFPQLQVARYLYNAAPDIFYTPRNGGHWVLTRAADGAEVFVDYQKFPNDPHFNKWKQLQTRHIPLQYDPPEHDDLRRVFTSFFTPVRVNKLEGSIRVLLKELINSFKHSGTFLFVKELSSRFPVTVFLDMVGAPSEDLDSLVEMANCYMRSSDREESRKGFARLVVYVKGLIAQRRASPGTDLVSHILECTANGRKLTEDEVVGAVQFFFLAGLDTVASMLSGVVLFLARNPGHYSQLVNDPSSIPRATEELMRVTAPSISERGVRADCEFRNITFKQGDRVLMLPQIYGLDEREMLDPERIDFSRAPTRQLGFGTGAHRCLGFFLARLELRIFLEEWTDAFPAFGLAPGSKPKFLGGIVWAPDEVKLSCKHI